MEIIEPELVRKSTTYVVPVNEGMTYSTLMRYMSGIPDNATLSTIKDEHGLALLFEEPD